MVKQGSRAKVGILSMVLVAYSGGCVSVSLAEVARAFPGVPSEVVAALVSVSGALGIAGSILSGILQRRLSQKEVLVLGTVCMGLGSLPVLFHESFAVLMAAVAFTGLGCGLLTSTAPAYISRVFAGEGKRRMLGAQMSLQGFGSMAFTLTAGALAVYAWWLGYAVYFVSFVSAALGVALLPAEPAGEEREPSGAVALSPSPREGLSLGHPLPLGLVALLTLLCLVCAAPWGGMSLHCSVNGIGGSGLTGLVLGCIDAGMVLGGAVSPRMARVFGENTILVLFLGVAAGLLVMGLARSGVLLCIAALLFGFSYACIYPRALALLGDLLSPDALPAAMALESALTSLGYTLGTPLIQAFGVVWPGHAATLGFYMMSVLAVVIAALLAVTRLEGRVLGRVAESAPLRGLNALVS